MARYLPISEKLFNAPETHEVTDYLIASPEFAQLHPDLVKKENYWPTHCTVLVAIQLILFKIYTCGDIITGTSDRILNINEFGLDCTARLEYIWQALKNGAAKDWFVIGKNHILAKNFEKKWGSPKQRYIREAQKRRGETGVFPYSGLADQTVSGDSATNVSDSHGSATSLALISTPHETASANRSSIPRDVLKKYLMDKKLTTLYDALALTVYTDSGYAAFFRGKTKSVITDAQMEKIATLLSKATLSDIESAWNTLETDSISTPPMSMIEKIAHHILEATISRERAVIAHRCSCPQCHGTGEAEAFTWSESSAPYTFRQKDGTTRTLPGLPARVDSVKVLCPCGTKPQTLFTEAVPYDSKLHLLERHYELLGSPKTQEAFAAALTRRDELRKTKAPKPSITPSSSAASHVLLSRGTDSKRTTPTATDTRGKILAIAIDGLANPRGEDVPSDDIHHAVSDPPLSSIRRNLRGRRRTLPVKR